MWQQVWCGEECTHRRPNNDSGSYWTQARHGSTEKMPCSKLLRYIQGNAKKLSLEDTETYVHPQTVKIKVTLFEPSLFNLLAHGRRNMCITSYFVPWCPSHLVLHICLKGKINSAMFKLLISPNHVKKQVIDWLVWSVLWHSLKKSLVSNSPWLFLRFFKLKYIVGWMHQLLEICVCLNPNWLVTMHERIPMTHMWVNLVWEG